MFKKILNPRLLRSALFALCVGSGSAQAAPAIRIVSTVPSAGMVTVTLNADAAATGHLTLLQGSGASCGSAAQIAVGQDSTNAPAYRQGALALAAGANASYTVRNLAQSTSYTLCATNGAGIDTATFSTAPMATYSVADWEAVGGAGISAGSAHSQSLSFAPDGTPYVAYSDGGHSNKTTVMRYNGAGWVNVGDAGFSAGWAEHQSLSFAPDGTPYVAYIDNNKSNKATVMRFVSGSWQVVGGVGFSAGAAQFSSLAFAPDGTPHVAYRDGGYGAKTTVMRYNGTAWVEVGSAGGLSVGLASYQSLSFAPDGTPYVAYMDNSKSYKTTVMRFVSGSWALVGSPGFSAGEAGYQSLSFAPDGTPYVAYRDVGNGGKATVMRFVGGSWETVGSPGFSAGEAYYQSLSFAPDGTPYVAYQDYGNSQKTTVMSYNGTDWVEVGSPGGLSAGEANGQSLAFAPDGTPYVAYRDYGNGNGNKTTVMRLAPVVPSAPTAVTAVAGDGQATVTFTAPASNGSAITGYSVTSSPAGGTGSCAAPPATTCTVTGLTNRTAYQFTVTATNGVGAGNSSAQSPAVTPVPAIRIVSTVPSAGMVTVTLNTNITATGYLTLLPGSSAICGTAANVQAGKASDSTTAAYRRGSLALAANTDASYTVRNLAHSASYTLCATDSADSVVERTTFNTPAMATYANPGWQAVGGAAYQWNSDNQSLAFAPDGLPYVAYQTGDKATVMRYNGTAWENVGNPGFSAGAVDYQSLSIAPDGTPYVAYRDKYNGSNKTTVMRLNGTDWGSVGDSRFSAGTARDQSLSFAPDGTPYVAYRDDGNGGKTTVKSFNGTDWDDVGSTGLSTDAYYQSLSFAPDGTPYVAYQNGFNGPTTVKSLNGTAWENVGSPGLSAGAADFQSLTFAPDGTPYVAYRDASNSYKTTVMRYNGTAWENVGSAGFSTGAARDQSLSFAPDGTPYVAYRDNGHSYKTTVMRFVGGSWETVGSPGLSAGAADYQSLSFAPDGTPYVAYQDGNGNGYSTMVMRLVGLPGVPTAVTAVAGNGQATVSFTAPAVAGSSAITGYTVTSNPDNITGTCTASPCTVTGLTIGQPYTFTVTANNGGGASAASGASGTVTPIISTLDIVSAAPSSNMLTATLNASTTVTGYLTVLQSGASCGTALQTKAGQDSTGAAAYRRGSLALVAGTPASYTVRNLAHSASYTLCATDSAGSAVASKNFTTLAMTTYTNPSWQAVGGAGFSAGATYQSLTFAPDGTPYVAYGDGGNIGKTTVMRFVGTAWENVGNAGFSAGAAHYQSLSIAPDGTPYVAYQDGGATSAYKTTVMRFVGTAWENVGNAGFSAGVAQYQSLSFAPDGTPYVAYQDASTNPAKTTVMRFVGTAWENVGSAGFSTGEAQYQSLSIAPDGTPYVAYLDGGNGGKTTVMHFDGSNWVDVGSAGFSTGVAQYQSLSFAPDGTPYVAYRDDDKGGYTTVMRYNGTAWENVGSAGFSAGAASSQSLTFAPDGTPYVAYRDDDKGGYTTVMRYNGTAWENVGSAGFSTGAANYQSLSFAPDGTPYVAYRDGSSGGKTTVMRLVTVPSAPTPVTAVAGNGTVALSWTAPSSDGGSAITGYSVTGIPGIPSGSCTPSPVTATTCTATGLTNGTAYTFSVVASNTVGNSAPATSTAVMPVAPAPPAPPPPPPPPPPPALIQLQVSTHGTGAGTVQRSVAGSVMSTVGNTTTVEYLEGQSVTLTAQPQAGARFSGWMGACSGLLPCHLTLRSNQAAQATFTDASTPAPVASCRSHVFSANEERVQDAYLAYYGRPADVAGLSYWVAYLASERGQIAAIIDAFGQSAEFQQRFGQLSNKQLIANLYQQMYGRGPDAAGAAFFESQLAAGRSSLASIAIHILDGRQGSDSAVVDNRKKVVRHFVTRVEELGSAAPTVDDGDALARFLSAVNGDEASALAGCARVDAFFDKAAP